MDYIYSNWLDDENVENVILIKYFRRRECPACNSILYEEFDYDGKQLSKFFEEHYKEEHIDCEEDPDNCNCDKKNCGRNCGH